MAATQTVVQDLPALPAANLHPLAQTETQINQSAVLRPRRGVVVLSGYGSSVRVDRGHLLIEDGVGSDRYRGKFPRIGHELERLVVIGADGVVSFGALRWLADQRACFVMLDRDGTVTRHNRGRSDHPILSNSGARKYVGASHWAQLHQNSGES